VLAAAPCGPRGAFAGKVDVSRRGRNHEDGEIIRSHEAGRSEEIIDAIEANAGFSVEHGLDQSRLKGRDGLRDVAPASREIFPPIDPTAPIRMNTEVRRQPQDRWLRNGRRRGRRLHVSSKSVFSEMRDQKVS
jgi:hypothetical protein